MTKWQAQAIEALNEATRSEHVPLAQYNTGDQVWLEATNLCFPLQATKLNPKWYGPFKIVKEISPIAYRLNLPPVWKIHNVFHTSLLLPYQETTAHRPNFTQPPPDLINGEEEFEVECIKGHRHQGRSKKLQYLIKWKGYAEADNTWEPADQVHTPELIKAYYKSIPKESIKSLLNCPRTTLLFHPGSHTAPLPLPLHHPQIPSLRTRSMSPYHPRPRPQTRLLLLRTPLPLPCLTAKPLSTTTPLTPSHPIGPPPTHHPTTT